MMSDMVVLFVDWLLSNLLSYPITSTHSKLLSKFWLLSNRLPNVYAYVCTLCYCSVLLFTQVAISSLVDCQVVAVDIRGHGEWLALVP